ncbi:envelope-like protein [Trifolium medium]|uniref:Envelope-like protein n=1 Tax=Trifolium medium TaxID=97028 RepID=A0A392N6A5_9FABA|nr:envelope-like protein [Trifolium medium]
MDNISFHHENSASRWKFVYNRRLAPERELGKSALECQELVDMISEAGLMKTVWGLGNCYEKLVKEFLVNIDVINQYLGRSIEEVADLEASENEICKTLTGNLVKKWPRKDKLSSTKLTAKYALLNKIAVVNWVPTTHSSDVATGLSKFIYAIGTRTKFDFGYYIFDQTIQHAKSLAVKMPIAFPTILCGIILNQHLGIRVNIDVPCKRESPLSLDYRLLEGTHVSDIATLSVKKPTATLTRKQMIADLKDVSKALGEKKFKVDLVIQALELEEETVAVETEVGQSQDNSDDDNAADDIGDDMQGDDTDGSPDI